jgi:hypothetical protein
MNDEKQVATLLAKINSGKLSVRELKQLSDNVTASARMSNDGRQQILSAIATRLRGSSTKRPVSKAPVREKFAIDLLQGVFVRSDRMFNLNRNEDANKVKIGGDMKGGKAAIDVYISYKTNKKRKIALDIRQEAEGQPPTCSVKDLVVGSSKGERTEFPLLEFEQAADLYLSKLLEVLPAVERPSSLEARSLEELSSPLRGRTPDCTLAGGT